MYWARRFVLEDFGFKPRQIFYNNAVDISFGSVGD